MTDDAALERARAAVDALHRRVARLDDNALDLIFREGRNHTKWQARDVPEALIREAVALAQFGPTSANGQPMRLVLVRSKEAKEKLKPTLVPGNVDKTMSAPWTLIVAYDIAYWTRMPTLYPIRDMSAMFKDNLPFAEEHGTRNGTLQGAYLIIALRAVGLDVGGMSGFNRKAVDEAFFAGTTVRSNFLMNVGYADSAGLTYARLPRVAFEDMATIQ
ncbi:MAG: malonic semialdehyde reductase [Alphaproteobacteria bacterium]|nr:malonic semialdehyde reductase [Alphaproteobacteria bacterium]